MRVLKTIIEKALVCDIKSGEYQGKPYHHLLVYSEGKLISIKIRDFKDNLKSFIGQYHKVTADFTTYDNKVKFSLVNIE